MWETTPILISNLTDEGYDAEILIGQPTRMILANELTFSEVEMILAFNLERYRDQTNFERMVIDIILQSQSVPVDNKSIYAMVLDRYDGDHEMVELHAGDYFENLIGGDLEGPGRPIIERAVDRIIMHTYINGYIDDPFETPFQLTRAGVVIRKIIFGS